MTSARGWGRLALLTATAYYSALLAPGNTAPALWGEGTAQARVNPLSLIAYQIHKPNILVVFDTSGSLTGVPGGSFDNATEVGVDCDDGENCRGGKAMGACTISKKACFSDDDCAAQSTCQLDAATCANDADCAPIAGACNQLTCDSQNKNCKYAACFGDGDCPASTSGKCAATNANCNPSQSCSTQLKCTFGSSACSSVSNPCLAYAVCKDGTGNLTSQQCNTDNDCPLQTKGTCSVGGAICNAGVVTSCAKVCPDKATNCSADSQCGVCNKGATGSLPGNYCAVKGDCSKSSATCTVTAGSCNVNNNTCILPHYACQVVQAVNPCINKNACVGPANTCTQGAAHKCVGPTPGDLCNAGTTASSASRMCRITQLKCSKDSDCNTPGDSCGPATSRVVVAKRVLASIITKNTNIANFGLMTFYQNKYFPYFSISSVTTKTETTYLSHGRLQGKKCYDKDTGPTATCVIDGVTYTLRGYDNSSYVIRASGGDRADTNFCGQFCAIPNQGTGNYHGSYYSYTVQTGTVSSSTKSVQSTYQGKNITVGGTPYRYYDSIPNYYNPYGSATAPPIDVANCGSSCNAQCGARWDTQLAPFMDTSDSAQKAEEMATAIVDRLQPASYGGLIAYGGTPTGCALKNDGAANENASAYHYMSKVKASDPTTCRDNFVLLITDGEANGPGDDYCTSNACSNADPKGAGCKCRAVLAAQELKKAGVNTLVVGFSGDVTAGNGRITNDNIAKAGGTDRKGDGIAPFAYGANNEDELIDAIQEAIYDAAKGSYATSPPTSSAGIQMQGKISVGSYALDARVDFPSWKGHLVAFDTTSGTPQMVWDAAVQLANMDWKTRRIYTSDSGNNLVQIQVASNGAITNKAALRALGLGSTDNEAEAIARWMLGDPTKNNPAILGALVNSTPIDVGQPGAYPNPGGLEFSDKYKDWPHVTYVGSDDGMLHAFYTEDVTIGSVTYKGGSEAFAYLPPEMLKHVTNVYAQGGQAPDPTSHLFGLASSPKVKSLCTSQCTDKAKAVWKTVLTMTDGYGGSEAFALDITDPTTSPPFKVMWHTATGEGASTFNTILGKTISVPAFFYNDTTNKDDNQVVFTSGYPVDPAKSADQGHWIVSASVADGAIVHRNKISEVGSCGNTPEYTLLTDVATARDYQAKTALLAAYAGDTWGNLWRFVPGVAPSTVSSLGCQQPLHYTPTVVQMDRDDTANLPRQVYLVQATNSPLDEVTRGFAPSRIVITRDVLKDGVVDEDASFGTNGTVTLTVGTSEQHCGVSNASGTSCATALPVTARPLGTPLAILKQDGTGFLALSNWYAPDPKGCTKGATYLQIHQVNVPSGVVTLKQALKVSDEPVSSPIVAGSKIVIMTSNGPVTLSGSVTQTFVAGQSSPSLSGSAAEPFKILGWSEAY